MLKRLAILAGAALIVAVILVAGYYQQHDTSSQGYDIKCIQPSQPPSAAASLTCKVYSGQNTDKGKSSPPWWHKLLAWPEGITAWLLLLTLGAVVWQSWGTWKAAKAAEEAALAALKQADHVSASERAWMIADIGPPSFGSDRNKTVLRITPRLRNKGKTLAFILESASVWIVLHQQESLPETPAPYREIAKWDSPGVPLAPEGEVGGEIVREFEETGKLISGQKVLWVYGYIKYNDVFRLEVRETKFCFRWEPSLMNSGVIQYSIDGPKGYNHAT